ncbi:MAG: TfoX/Sxy family protein [Actinomycetota bacterium]
MFGSTGLCVRGKVFAVVDSAGDLMVKIPESRTNELIAAGVVTRMVMRDREMREWVTMPVGAGIDRWHELAGEAYAYLDEITPR